MADPATSLALNGVQDPNFLWEQLLYSDIEKIHVSISLINIANMKTLSLNIFSKPTKCSFKSLFCNMRPSDPPPRCVAYMCQVKKKKKKKKSAPAQASPSGTRTVTGASLEHFEAIVWRWLLTWDPRPTGKLPPEGPFRGQLFKLSTITLLSPSRFAQPLSAAHRKACEESEVTFLNCYSRTVACCVLLKKKNTLCLLYARPELQPSA